MPAAQVDVAGEEQGGQRKRWTDGSGWTNLPTSEAQYLNALPPQAGLAIHRLRPPSH
jgi:hypothetical protein